jgi:hypothetical protein
MPTLLYYERFSTIVSCRYSHLLLVQLVHLHVTSYFRQLQEISDTVAEVQWEGSLVDAMEATKLDNANLGAKINTRRARQRYLEHLAKGGSGVDNEDAVCILCQCEFLRGFVTQWYEASSSRRTYADVLNSAHIFCEVCFVNLLTMIS